MRHKAVRIVLACIVLSVALLAAGWQLFCYCVHMEVSGVAPPANFGNWERNRHAAADDAMADASDHFRFVVAGDSRGYGTFEVLMEELKKLNPDFLILLGDIARHGTEADHKFLQLEMSTEMQTDFPVFYVVGNHDIVPDYPPSVWEKTYGPAQCFFKRNGNLFILAFIPEIDPQAEIGIRFVEKTLQEQGPHAKRIFVFNHVPPRVSPDSPFDGFPHQDKLLDLLRRYEVDYFIAGDYHSYACARLNGTNIIVSGGGGSRLKGGSFGFHHAAVFDVSDTMVQERLCVIPGILALEDRLESEAIVACIPFIARHPFLVAGVDILLLGLTVAVAVNAAPKLRRRFRLKGTWMKNTGSMLVSIVIVIVLATAGCIAQRNANGGSPAAAAAKQPANQAPAPKPADGRPQLPPAHTVARKAADPITIDGKLNEQSWKNAERLPVEIIHNKARKTTPGGFGRFTWDADSFYIGFEVIDTDIQAQGDSRDACDIVPPRDVIEIFLDTINDDEHFLELHLNALNAFNDIFIVRPREDSPLHACLPYKLVFATSWNLASYQTAVQVSGTVNKADDEDKGWTAEIKLPFKSLLLPAGQKQPKPGDVWRAQLVVQDGDAEERYLEWSPGYEAWFHHGIATWGRVEFGE